MLIHIMLPSVSNIESDAKSLTMTIENCSVSLPNAVRRTVISDIPCIVINTDVESDNGLVFHTNSTRLTNEMIAQRLACIPVHITDVTFPLSEYSFEIKVQNLSEKVVIVSSENISLLRGKKKEKVDKAERDRIFPADSLTNDHIDIVSLRPSVVSSLPTPALHITGSFTVVTARQNGCFSVVTEATCVPTQDVEAVRKALLAKEKEWLKEKHTPSILQLKKNDYLRTDAHRLTIDRAFTIKLSTVGVFTPREILGKAVEVLDRSLVSFSQQMEAHPESLKKSSSTIPNSYDLEFTDNSVTIGRLLDSIIYDQFYSREKIVTYSGFSKPHPHRNRAILRFAFPQKTSIPMASEFISKTIAAARNQVEAIASVLR